MVGPHKPPRPAQQIIHDKRITFQERKDVSWWMRKIGKKDTLIILKAYSVDVRPMETGRATQRQVAVRWKQFVEVDYPLFFKTQQAQNPPLSAPVQFQANSASQIVPDPAQHPTPGRLEEVYFDQNDMWEKNGDNLAVGGATPISFSPVLPSQMLTAEALAGVQSANQDMFWPDMHAGMEEATEAASPGLVLPPVDLSLNLSWDTRTQEGYVTPMNTDLAPRFEDFPNVNNFLDNLYLLAPCDGALCFIDHIHRYD